MNTQKFIARTFQPYFCVKAASLILSETKFSQRKGNVYFNLNNIHILGKYFDLFQSCTLVKAMQLKKINSILEILIELQPLVVIKFCQAELAKMNPADEV